MILLDMPIGELSILNAYIQVFTCVKIVDSFPKTPMKSRRKRTSGYKIVESDSISSRSPRTSSIEQ